MLEHVKVLGILGIVRSLLAAAFGLALLLKAPSVSLFDYGKNRFELESPIYDEQDGAILSFDKTAFLVVGVVCVALALARLTQGVGALFCRRWARRFGLGLACFDIFNLPLFPLSTALGLYALVVYRKEETVERFEARRKASPLAAT